MQAFVYGSIWYLFVSLNNQPRYAASYLGTFYAFPQFVLRKPHFIWFAVGNGGGTLSWKQPISVTAFPENLRP